MEFNLTNKIKDRAYVINLDEHSNIGTHWIALYALNAIPLNNNATYFDSFGVEHIPTEIKKIINNQKTKAKISRIKGYDSVMCGYFCIEFIDFLLQGKSLTDFTNLFSPNHFKKNDDVTLNYFMTNL